MASAKDFSRESTTATSVKGMCLYLCVQNALYNLILYYYIIILVLHHMISYIVLYCAMFHDIIII